jgi:N4-gp56 family major capsid protein
MAGEFSPTGSVTNTTAATFIPELWSDEIIAAYKKNLVLANLVNKMPMRGKKGDTIHIPKPTRGDATKKLSENQVTLIAATETEVIVPVDQHYEYSRLIEDITEVQALASLRKFYTDDAGYALARQVDNDLFNLGKSLGNGNGTSWAHTGAWYNDAVTGLAQYAEDTVTEADGFDDEGFRAAIQLLDDADVPMDGRFFVIPPVLRNAIMGIDRYQSSDFVDGRGVQNGKIGTLYGIDIYVSTNVPVIETAAANTASTVDTRGAILGHKDAMVLAEQVGVRAQTQYKQEYLATLFTSDTLYGIKVLRPESAIVFAVPNIVPAVGSGS